MATETQLRSANRMTLVKEIDAAIAEHDATASSYIAYRNIVDKQIAQENLFIKKLGEIRKLALEF